MTLRIEPLYGLILVRRVDEPSKSRIVTPDSARKKSQRAEVVAVGPGRYSTAGTLLPCMVKVGDQVLMSEWAGIGTEVRHMDEDMLLVKEEAILAILRGYCCYCEAGIPVTRRRDMPRCHRVPGDGDQPCPTPP